MGVPGLSKALKPYSVSTTVGCKTAGCIQHQPQHGGQIYMVIDGPSFAYCIYQRVIAAKAEWLTAIEAIPSYDEVGNGAIAFLEVLENYGVEMYVFHTGIFALRSALESWHWLIRLLIIQWKYLLRRLLTLGQTSDSGQTPTKVSQRIGKVPESQRFATAIQSHEEME